MRFRLGGMRSSESFSSPLREFQNLLLAEPRPRDALAKPHRF